MPSISYSLKVKNSFTNQGVDNTPRFNRPVREMEQATKEELSISSFFNMRDGKLINDYIVEDRLLKYKYLNGPILLFDDLQSDKICTPQTQVTYNNLDSYIFKRIGSKLSISNIYKASYLDNKFQIPLFEDEKTDTISVTSDMISDKEVGTNKYITIKTRYFPVKEIIEISGLGSSPSYDADLINGIIRFDVSSATALGADILTINYKVQAVIYPLTENKESELTNSSDLQNLYLSNLTNSEYDIINIEPKNITLQKTPENTSFVEVSISNYSGETLFIEPEQDIQINNQIIESGSDNILVSSSALLKIKLKDVSTPVSTFKLDVGIYDRYNHVKKYIDKITINVTT